MLSEWRREKKSIFVISGDWKAISSYAVTFWNLILHCSIFSLALPEKERCLLAILNHLRFNSSRNSLQATHSLNIFVWIEKTSITMVIFYLWDVHERKMFFFCAQNHARYNSQKKKRGTNNYDVFKNAFLTN